MDGLLCTPGQVRKEAASVVYNWVVQPFALPIAIYVEILFTELDTTLNN